MKKIIALFLVAVLCFSFAACGENKSLKDEVVGTWVREFTGENGKKIQQVLEIYEGGTGELNSTGGYHYEGKWNIEDDVLNFSYTFVTRGFHIDTSASPMTLTEVSNEESVFVKVE